MSIPEIALPRRPLSLKSSAVSLPRGFFWFVPVIMVLAGFIIWWQGPGLWRDYQISLNPVVLQDGDIRNGKCTTRKGVMTECKAKLAYTYQGRSYQTETHFLFVDMHSGSYLTELVISGDRPELATLTLGLEKIWNRAICFAILGGLMVLLSCAMVFLAIRVWRVRGQIGKPAELTLIPVAVTAAKKSGKRLFVTYVDKIAPGMTKRTAYTLFGRDEEPLFLTDPRGNLVGAAVRHGKTALPVMIDAGLQRIALTAEEREAALSSIRAAEADANEIVMQAAPKRKLQWMQGLKTLLVGIVLVVVAALGYWAWYVTTSPTQFDQIGMEINNVMPGPLNEWGCGQLQKRFGDDRAPRGCSGADHLSWK
ncbi:hypothetical protein [Rhizobium wenxiniae]|uniref:hypothetical protein n=1 Tax=Rhizobium wenxiniae TaxID=1737357 RepID=UPI003C213F7C